MARNDRNGWSTAWRAVLLLWVVTLGGCTTSGAFANCGLGVHLFGCEENWADQLLGVALIGVLLAFVVTVVVLIADVAARGGPMARMGLDDDEDPGRKSGR
jgi:hypothetical protein